MFITKNIAGPINIFKLSDELISCFYYGVETPAKVKIACAQIEQPSLSLKCYNLTGYS